VQSLKAIVREAKTPPRREIISFLSLIASLLSLKECVFRIIKDIGNMDSSRFEQRARSDGAAAGPDHLLFQIVYPFGNIAAAGSTYIALTLSQKDE
jgi:hypothetical protein